MIDFCRMDACPRCRRNFPDDPKETGDAAACPVCRGRPVRVLVLWNDAVDKHADPVFASAQTIRHAVAGEAALVAADLVARKDGACGSVAAGSRASPIGLSAYTDNLERAFMACSIAEEMAILDFLGRHKDEWVRLTAEYQVQIDRGEVNAAFEELLRRRREARA